MRSTLSIFCAVALSACTSVQDAPTQSPQVLQVEAERILRHAKEAPEGDYLLVVDKPIQLSLTQREQTSAEEMGIPHELLQKLLADRPHRLPWSGDGQMFRIVTKREIDDIFRRDPDWPRFYSLYPHSRGFVEFAGPVFNHDQSEALIYVSFSCYGDCGWGSVVHYERTGDQWVKRNEWLHWFS